jgi:fructokinase
MILCAGEALIDMLPRDTAEGAAFLPVPGGSVFNTAIALGRLGSPVRFFSGISTDLFGARLMEALNESAVDARLAARSDRPTTLAFVTLVDGQARYAFYDENTAGRMVSPQDLPALVAVEALFFGGISLPVEPCGAAYEALCLRAAPNLVIMVDPNIRPGFITDEPRYRARLTAMLSAADIVKVSDEDLHWLFGTGDEASLAKAVRALGPSLVAVTRGARGVAAYGPHGLTELPGNPVEVVDTVGAGDTFNAGLLEGLRRVGALSKQMLATGLDEAALVSALTLGQRAAAVTVSRAGANPPWAHEL